MHYVQRNGGSTRSLSNIKSHIRVHCRLLALGWLDEAEGARLTLLERSLRFDDYGAGRRKRPLVASLLAKLLHLLDFEDPVQLQLAATLALGHDGLLRGGEIWSSLKRGDVLWHEDGEGFGLSLGRTKTMRSGGPTTITFRSASKVALSAVNIVRRWMNSSWKRREDKDKLFPGFKRLEGGFTIDEEEEEDKQIWIAFFRGYLARLGWEPTEFAGHSLRAGGATDLFNSNMPLASIMKIGRWKSVAAAMVYFRDDRVIAEEAAQAFARMQSEGR